MKIKGIITARDYEKWPNWDLIYEWEDVIAKELDISLIHEKKIAYNKYVVKVPYLAGLLQTSVPSFKFDMTPTRRLFNSNNKKTIVPCIVDFFLKDTLALKKFYKRYDRHPVVLISSREVYEYLKDHDCPLRIIHFPLSISDKYKIKPETLYEKTYDMVLMGRQNPILEEYVKRYAAEHPLFYYVYRVQKNGVFNYYTSKGEYLGDINSREKYMSLMRKARIGLYSTPGIDGGEKRTNGFNQVTPRFLELIACGCHIIARYPDNADTRFYKLSDFCPSMNRYEDFKKAVESALSCDVNMEAYSEYLSSHYTSMRCRQLQEIINQI